MRARRIALILLAALSCLSLAPAQASHDWLDDLACTDTTDDVHVLPESLTTPGFIALPEEADHVVAFTHGYGHRSTSWVEHLKRAAKHGAIAFAIDGPATYVDAQGNVRGWDVTQAADYTNFIASAVAGLCEIDSVAILGVSMGGNTSGMALAKKPKIRPGSTEPLYDYWVAVEPAANVTETYIEASLVAPTNAYAQRAKEDIEREMDGTPVQKPAAYLERTLVARGADLAASGVKGVAVVHAFDDGLVPYNQGRELTTVLRANSVPTDMYNVGRREQNGTPNGSDNTTITENVLRPALGALGRSYDEPLAGHGTESSQTNIVIQTGFDVLFAILKNTSLPADNEYLVDPDFGILP